MSKRWIKNGIAIALTATAVCAAAQGDSPTHRGQNARVGVNPSPTEPGPGRSNLRWWHPLQSVVGRDFIIDNVDPVDYSEPTGTWNTPSPLDESGDFFVNTPVGNFDPYRWTSVVASTAGTGNQTAGATATAQWTINGVPGRYYALNVWFPSSGTRNGGILVPNSMYAVYKIEFSDTSGTFQEFVDVVPHLGGGTWIRLGKNLTQVDRIFRAGDSGVIRITLYNTVPRDDDDNLLGPVTGRIVCADAVLAVPAPGSIYASPVVKFVGPNPTDTIAVSVRNESRPDPTDPTRTRELQLGKVYALDADGTNISLERWSWSPDLLPNVNQAFDNLNGAVFNADAAWSQPANMSPGFYASNYVDADVDLVYPGSGVARWTPTLQDGDFDVYVWFPSNGNGNLHARGARYVINENGVQHEIFLSQEQGGNWVRLGTRPYNHTQLLGGLRVEVWNYSNNPADAGRRVCADAVMFVGNYTGAMYSTPTIANVNIRRNDGTIVPTECVFVAAEDGRVYCLDARGNAFGGTTVYWAWPSLPDNSDPNWSDPNDNVDGPVGNRIPYPSSYGLSSIAVARVGSKDLLYIATQNGRVYAIDTIGRGDYDPATGKPGTAIREWTWPRARYIASSNTLIVDPARPAFVSSVAYDANTSQVFIGGTEGRLFALDAAGNGDQTTDMNWAWPALTDLPVGAISSTPAIGGGRVIVTSFDGRVYARDVNGSGAPGANWQYPASNDPPLTAFSLTSVCYVEAARVGTAFDMAYFVNENGYVYGLRGDTGTLEWSAREALTGAVSSPYFTRMQPPGRIGIFPVITVALIDGSFRAFYAHPSDTNSAGGRLAWGWQSRGNSAFASPAVAYSWMYHAGLDGYLYAFNDGTGLISDDPGFDPPGDEIETPDNRTTDYDNLKWKFINRTQYAQVRANPPASDPRPMPDLYPQKPTFEWGERLYIVAYDFPFDAAEPVTIRFRMTGPGGLNLQYDRVAVADPFSPGLGMASMSIPVMGNGPNFITPGDLLLIDVLVVEDGTIIDPPAPPRDAGVANPLALTSAPGFVGTPPAGKSIGWSPDPDYVFNGVEENKINGSNDKRLLSSAGEIVHGQSGQNDFFITDRSRMIELTNTGLNQVRMIRNDGAWQGGSAAVFKPLPYVPAWEVMPDQYPNLSLDYPNLDRTLIRLVVDPFGQSRDPLIAGVQLAPPTNFDPDNPLQRVLTPVRVGFSLDVPRFQPANLTEYVDADGQPLDGGYVARAIVYVDSNGNGRPDGQAETLTDLPPTFRREAYRSMNLGGSVPVDETIDIVEPTVDLGAQPHSLGYTPAPPWTLNGFVPDISAGAPYRTFFKPFTVRNHGNVNMLDLRVAKRIGQLPGPNYYSVSFGGDANDPLAWLDGLPNIISNLNPPYSNPPFVPDTGAVDASGNQRITLHKARPGDRAATLLTIPDVPYGQPTPPNSEPVIGVAVPLGHPVGDFSQLINVIEDRYLINGQNDIALMLGTNGQPLEPFTDPTMKVRFINRETRLTGGQTFGSVPHIDNNLGQASQFTWTNTAPSAFRDPLGGLHMVWTSNRPGLPNTPAGPQPVDNWNLFYAHMRGVQPGGSPVEAGISPLRDLMGWRPLGSAFWTKFSGPSPSDNPNTLFGGTPGNVVGTPNYGSPSFPVNTRPVAFGANPEEWVAWSGRAVKDTGSADNRIFLARYQISPQAINPAIGPTQWIAYDTGIEKKRLRLMNLAIPDRLAIFWHGEVNGKTRMFHNVRERLVQQGGDQTNNWSRNALIDPGAGFVSTADPTPIYRGPGVTDLVFTGLLKGRVQSEIFYSKWIADGFGRMRQIVNQPERNRETLTPEGATGAYRSRGVNWDTGRPIEVWIRRPGQAEFRIDIPNTRSVDSNSGVVSFNSETGGKIFCDPNAGTVTFSAGGPGAGAAVELRYTPRVVRISEIGQVGGSSNPSSFLDNRADWNRNFWFNNQNQPIGANDQPAVGRMWHLYERGATGHGQAHRPYMKTQRLMIRLNYPIRISGGVPVISVAGMSGPFYQADPGNARVFFTIPDEGREMTVTYEWVDGNGNIRTDTVVGRAIWQNETNERPVPIEQAVDEGSIFAFPDPFFQNYNPNDPRPGIVWLFYTSTRAGTRDVYYQTLAPRLGPSVIGN